MQGFKEMLKQLEPKRILIYGNTTSGLEEYDNIQWFEPYTNKWNKKAQVEVKLSERKKVKMKGE